ncbi:hypothetical protein [Xanthomonas phage XAJ2]|uniref:Uncharacterized protein n=1 Tax=Xanthomonas phage XAJ2 TaxID=1775249 RepID=A0A1I9L2I4_9CAUD|nr:hypothetical protein [Xanthomonas phage XAJ2]
MSLAVALFYWGTPIAFWLFTAILFTRASQKLLLAEKLDKECDEAIAKMEKSTAIVTQQANCAVEMFNQASLLRYEANELLAAHRRRLNDEGKSAN